MTIEMRLELNIQNPFATLNLGGLRTELEAVEVRWATKLRAIAMVYPQTLPGQVYVRTFVFRDSWRIGGPTLVSGDLVCDLTNDTPYSPYVVGNDIGSMQNQLYHAGRWYLFRKLVEASAADFVQDAQNAMNRALGPVMITP